MKAPPVATFVMPQSEFLLQFLVVTLNAPATHHRVRPLWPGHARWQVAEPVVCGLLGAFHPFDDQPLLATGWSRWGARTRIRAKRERNGPDVPSRQVTLCQACTREGAGHLSHGDGLVVLIPLLATTGSTPLAGKHRFGQWLVFNHINIET
jgi:hypothetical protein